MIESADAIESPCISVCQLSGLDLKDPNTHCMGCYRTVAEIASWGRMSPAQRRNIMDTLNDRKIELSRKSN
ncbi:MAG: DUF1289 domain-containing protein [Pseudomonadota bacterium]